MGIVNERSTICESNSHGNGNEGMFMSRSKYMCLECCFNLHVEMLLNVRKITAEHIDYSSIRGKCMILFSC